MIINRLSKTQKRKWHRNQKEMKDVQARFTLAYAGCIKGHMAAEVYAARDTIKAVKPCGDARP